MYRRRHIKDLVTTRYTLHAIRYTLLALFVLLCLMPEDVFAGAMSQGSRMMRMPKYSLWGSITLQYEGVNNETNGQTTNNTNRFTQNYRLNFQSYVISPRIMYYTITTEIDVETGTMAGAEGATKSYGINTTFFPYQPLNFSLRASRTDGRDYEISNYGLTVSYTRRVSNRISRNMRDVNRNININNVNKNTNANSNINVNANANANANSNANSNANINPRANIDANANANANANVALKRNQNQGPGLFSDILPRIAVLDIDRTTVRQRDSETLWNNASLRFKGNAPRTTYFLNFNYNDWKRDSTGHKGFGGDLSTSTSLKWSFFQQFDNYIYFRKNDIMSYSINSSLSGSAKKWGYSIAGNYTSTSNSEKTHEFNFSINLSRSGAYPFVYKGITFNYSFNFGMERVRNRQDLWAGTTLNAHKRFGANTDLNSSLSITGGTQSGTAVNFLTGISYTFRPRKGYTLRVELDPQRDIIKTRTFKPQVRGWDYSIRTGYTFGISKVTGERTGVSFDPVARGAAETNKTLISHRADLNINVYLRMLTLSSDAVLYYTDVGKYLSWNNSIYATVMGKIGVTIGTGMTVDMPKGGSRTTNYSVYNLLSYSPWRTAFLRLDSRYTKTVPGDTTTLEITPSLTWRWRSVFMDFSLSFKKYKGIGGAESTERRIMLRATRPFRIL